MARADDRFIKEIQGSHHVIAYVDVIDPSGRKVRLKVIDGNVAVDRTAAIRRQGSLTAIDTTGELTPKGAQGILTPLGTEVRLYRGVQYNDGTQKVYSLGVFMLSVNTIVESVGRVGGNYGPGQGDSSAPSAGSSGSGGGVQMQIQIYDRSRRISRDKFSNVYTIAAGTNVVDAIKKIVRRTIPGINFDAITHSQTIPTAKVYDASTDPWTACTDLATSIGCDVYFDTDGDVVIAPPPDIDRFSDAEYTYIEGQGCTMTEIGATYTDDPGYNGVIVIGGSVGTSTAAVRAEAWDDEPSSPTYRHGPYGRVPQFVNDSTITTQAAAQAAANHLLKGLLGFSEQLSITAGAANPALEAGDTVAVKRDRLNIDALYTVQSFNVPLRNSGTQVLTMYKNRTTT